MGPTPAYPVLRTTKKSVEKRAPGTNKQKKSVKVGGRGGHGGYVHAALVDVEAHDAGGVRHEVHPAFSCGEGCVGGGVVW